MTRGRRLTIELSDRRRKRARGWVADIDLFGAPEAAKLLFLWIVPKKNLVAGPGQRSYGGIR
jgi:hypothetical protein